MRKPVVVGLIALIVILAGVSAEMYSRYRKTNADYMSMKDEAETSKAQYTQTIDAIAEIQDSLNAIAPREGSLSSMSGSLSAEQKLAGPNREQVLDRLAALRASIQRSKERISRLESDLHRNGIKVAGLTRMLANLKSSLAEKQEQVAQLTGQVDQLHSQVQGLEGQVAQTEEQVRTKDAALEDRRRELATVYYAIGSKKQLSDKGLVEAKGGLLGLGKTLAPSSHINEAALEPLDTDQATVLETTATHAQVVTAQPASSYELKMVNGHVQLHIIDPKEFRKVKHLVIVTA